MPPESVIPPPFTSLDVGSPSVPGSATPVSAGWDIVASGADIWERSDQFHFVFTAKTGDFDVAVRVESFTPAHLYSKAGVMVRESLDAGSAHVMFVLFAGDAPRNNNLGAYEMQFRAATGGECQAIYPAVRPPAPPEFPATYPNAWMRVTRRGDRFSALASTDGLTWRLYAEHVMAMAPTCKVGVALTSHEPQATARAAFRDYTERG